MQKTVFIIGLGRSIHAGAPLPAIAQPIVRGARAVYSKLPAPMVQQVTPMFDAVDGLSDGFRTLAEQLLAEMPSVLLVPGDPRLDDAAVPVIESLAAERGVTVKLISAPDELSRTLHALQLSPAAGLQILDATLACSFHHPPLEPHRPALITGLYHPDLIAPLRRALGTIYPAGALLQAVTADGVQAGSLTGWDDTATAIFLPPQKEALGLTKFQETIAHLRAPSGCPWDKKQTHQSLRSYLLEETHEVLAALDAGDVSALAEELGDVLLQILLHAQIGSEADEFRMADVIRYIDAKIVRRHSHVFGNVSVNSAEEVTANWAAIKAQEKAENGNSANDAPASALDGVPPTLPALSQALNISQKVVELGFEWQTIEGVLEKLVEEAREIATADKIGRAHV